MGLVGGDLSNSKVYVISDTHFGHSNILKFEPLRSHYKDIQEHDKDLVERWNSVVRSEDTVWHLGDVYFGSKDSAKDVLQSLKGYKRLVLGNHDAKKEEFLRQFFEKIYGVAEYGKCILSHIPVHPYQLEKRYMRNIHGHMHSKCVYALDYNSDPIPDKRYVCVSVEQTNFQPILLQKVIQS